VSITVIRTLYNAALLLLLLLGSPWWLLRYVTSRRFREGMGQRFFGPPQHLGASACIWIHAVSVGEVLAVSGLARELEMRVPHRNIIISTTTRTGQALARERFGPERCFYFPLDFPWSVRAAVHRLKPSMLVLAESELWPNVLVACSREKIPVVVVNARVSDRSFPRYLRLRPLWRPFFKLLKLVLAQSREDAWRLHQIDVPSDRIKVTGNLKFDSRAPRTTPLSSLFREHLPLQAKLFVCGSTLEGEEALLLAAWPKILAGNPNAVMLVAPRHPERFETVAALLEAAAEDCKVAWYRRTQWTLKPTELTVGSIFLLDSIGELASLYALARIAFVGGSLIPAGGHNPLEPAQFAVPITMGPHYQNFREIVDLLRARDAIRILQPAAIATEISNLLQDDHLSARMGHNAQRFFEAETGATSRSADAIVALLTKVAEA
jgi:3-deoxy-D-manno-octulosonic-acid transferase